MLTKEEFNDLINTIKSNLDESVGALISEDLLKLIANYTSAIDKIDEINNDLSKVKDENSELWNVNKQLFKRIGFDEKPEEKKPLEEKKRDEIEIEELVSEKVGIV